MKEILISIFFLLEILNSFAQSYSIPQDKKASDGYFIRLVPSAAHNIYGLAIGPVGSEAIRNRPYTKHSHGVNIQIIGMGIVLTYYLNEMNFKDREIIIMDSLNNIATPINMAAHNGLLISLFGTLTDEVNGISVSSWMSMGRQLNGISYNIAWNLYDQLNGISIGMLNQEVKMNGFQLGLVNMSKRLRGFQIGVWNKNEKRSLPILNWNFK